MNSIKNLIKKYFKHFYFFYGFLRYRIFISLGLSLMVGVLDGLGLALFLPLLQMVDGKSKATVEGLGKLGFLLDGFEFVGLSLTVTSVLMVMLLFFVLKGLMKFVESIYRMRLARFFIRSLRFSNIDLLCGYQYKAFVSADIGRLQSTMAGEVGMVQSGYRSYFATVQAFIMVLVYVGLAVATNYQFALLVIIGAIVSNLAYQQLYKKTVRASRNITKGGHRFQALLIQQVAYFKYLKASGLIRRYAKKLKSVISEMEAIRIKMSFYDAIVQSTREPLIVMVVVAVVIVQVTYFSQSIGAIILSLLFFYRSLTFLMNLQTQWNAFLGNSGSLENMSAFIAELKAAQEKSGKEKFTQFSNSMELMSVDFNYGIKPVLKNINLRINKNETVAIVGESGSGKTTLVNVLSGLLPLSKGEFLIDGKRSEQIDMQTYQQRLGYITQDPVIFSDTIFNNVTFWAEKTPESEAKFWESLRKASLEVFVRSLYNQENSKLGNNGILVSGGQKQRISIARELYKNVDILIMDEATSSLDSETENVIQENIDVLKGQYTILIVAHRLSTVKKADRVVLMSEGKIEEVGPFEQLKLTSKRFEKMVELQEL
jgi:ABC-type multidrug transport system fused ATPase/permease subunit